MAAILVIDDETDERELICSWLEEAGHIVRSASSGESGLEMFKAMHTDMAIVDIFMPGIGGLRTIRTMREASPDARIIAMSGYLHDTVLSDVVEVGAVSIEKPFSPDQLLRRVSESLALVHSK